MEGPYTTYCTKYHSGFDVWEPVQSNPRLAATLATFSASSPPPSLLISTPSDPPVWTLDALFLLPKARLKYYKKLYNRLLKSTAPGRSDHRLLIGALDKLDKLLATVEGREALAVGSSSSSSAPLVETEDEVVIDMRTHSMVEQNGGVRMSAAETALGSEGSSVRGSILSSGWVIISWGLSSVV